MLVSIQSLDVNTERWVFFSSANRSASTIGCTSLQEFDYIENKNSKADEKVMRVLETCWKAPSE